MVVLVIGRPVEEAIRRTLAQRSIQLEQILREGGVQTGQRLDSLESGIRRFTGNESVNNGAVESQLTGSWAHGQLRFTVQRPTGAVTYTARLTRDDLDELVLEGPGGPTTIRRQE